MTVVSVRRLRDKVLLVLVFMGLGAQAVFLYLYFQGVTIFGKP